MVKSELVKISFKEINGDTICFTHKTHRWCTLPYSGHPNGCPNYNKNVLCPPKAQSLKNLILKYNFHYLIYGKFDIKQHKAKLKKKYPHWSDKQTGCVLYWQSSVKKYLREFIEQIYSKNPNKSLYLLACGSGFKNGFINQKDVYSMEAGDINVFKTLKDNNIPFELKPKNYVLLVNLLSTDKRLG